MAGQLDDLHEAPAVEGSADDKPRVGELLAVMVVHLVAVPVALEDDGVAIQLARLRPLGHLDRLRPEAHRPAEILDSLLLRQEVDDRERRLRVHLRRVGAVEADDVPRELRHCDMHPEADAEVRDATLARDLAREDLPLPAA